MTCPFTSKRIVSYDDQTVTTRAYKRDTVETRFHRAIQPTGRVSIYDRVTGEYVDWDVATDAEREAGY